MDARVERIMTAADYIAAKLDGRKPFAGIVLGSGLGKLADQIENQIVIPYKEIPGFPVSTAVGHKGNFIAGELGGKFVEASSWSQCRGVSIFMKVILWSSLHCRFEL